MGHTFGNHTYNHARLVGLSREKFAQEVLATEQALGTLCNEMSAST